MKYFAQKQLPTIENKKYFNRQRTQTVGEKITDLENTLQASGADVPKKTQRSALDRFLSAISVGNYGMMGGATAASETRNANKQAYTKAMQDESNSIKNVGDFFKTFVNHMTGNSATAQMELAQRNAAVKGITEGVKGANPFGDKYEAGRKTATNWFDAEGWHNDDTKSWYAPQNLGRNVAAFGADVFLDPTTYMTFGAGGLVRGTGKTVAGKAAEKTLKEGGMVTEKMLQNMSKRELAQMNIDSVFKQLGTQGVKDELAKVGIKVTDDEIPDIIAKVRRDSGAFNKVTGQSSFGSKADDLLRRIGDNTIAPYVNTAFAKLSKTKAGQVASVVGDSLGNLFNKGGKQAAEMASTDPLRYMKEVNGGIHYVNKAFTSYAKMQKEFTDDVRSKFEDISPEVRTDITNLIESKDAMQKFEAAVKSHDITKLSDAAVELTKNYDLKRKEIDGYIDAYKKIDANDRTVKVLESYKDTMENIGNVKSQMYRDLLDASTELKKAFGDEANFEIFLNSVRNESKDSITKKLSDMGIDNAEKAAVETRKILDKAVEGDGASIRKYFVGQQTLTKPNTMDAGRPNTQVSFDGMDEYIPDPELKQSWSDKWDEFYKTHLAQSKTKIGRYTIDNNTPINSLKDIQDAFLFHNEKNMSADDFLTVQKMFNETKKLNTYKKQTAQDAINEVGMKNLQKYFAKDQQKAARSKKISEILEQFENTLKPTANAREREEARANWMMKLGAMSDDKLEAKYQNALKFKDSVKSKPVNKHDELARKIAGYIVTASRATQARENVRSFKDVYALMSGKTWDDLKLIERQLRDEGKGFNFRDVEKEVDSGRTANMADRVEGDRAKAKPEYAGMDEEGLIANNALGKSDEWLKAMDDAYSFTDSSKKVTNKYFTNGESVKHMDDAFNVGTKDKPKYQYAKYNVYNVDGLEIYQPVNVRTDATVAAIIKGAQNVGLKDKNLARLLSTMKVWLSDIDGAAEAITGGGKVIVGKNTNGVKDFEKLLSDKVVAHEVGHEFGAQIDNLLFHKGEESDWLKAIKQDGNELFQGRNVLFGKGGVDYKLMHEDLAESFRMFLTNPKAFKASYPYRYAELRKGLNNLKVPDKNINKTVDPASYVPLKIEAALDNEKMTLEAQTQALLNKVKNISKEDAQTELDRIAKLQENNYFNKAFSDLFNTLHPDEELYTKEAVMVNKTTARLDVENEAANRILSKYAPDDQKKITELTNFIADQFHEIYDKEVAGGWMHQDRRIDYVPHQNVKTGSAVGSSGNYVKKNQFDAKRKINDTILERNKPKYDKASAEYEAVFGEKPVINNASDYLTAVYDVYASRAYARGDEVLDLSDAIRNGDIDGDVLEDDITELLLMRGLKTNQLFFTKQFYNHIVENFGTVYKELVNVPAGTKLHASSEDIHDILKKSFEVKKFDENKFQTFLMDARINGEAITKEVEDEARDAATSISYDIDGLEKLTKELGLSKGFVDALKDGNENIEAFLKLSPITPIDEKAFAHIKNIDPRFTAFSASDMLIDKLNKAGSMQIDQNKGIWLSLFDKAQGLWKINATSANLGFGVRNAMSNQFQQFLNVGYEAMNPHTQLQAARLAIGKIDESARIKVGSKEYTERELLEKAQELGVLNGSLITDMIKGEKKTFLQNVTGVTPAIKKLVDTQKRSGKDVLKTIGQSVNPLDAKNNVVYRAGGFVNEKIENQSRMNLFLANLKQGKGLQEAADNVNKFLFDYGDVTDFEQNVMKRLVPFYTWMRKNIPLQLEQFVNNPRAYSMYAKVVNNVNDLTPEDQRLKDDQKNQFAQDWMQLPFSTVAADGSHQPTFFNANLPLNDLDKMDATAAGKNIFTSLTPFLKVPVELTMNKNIFFNNDISKGIGDTDDAPGYLQALMGGTKENPAQMDPKTRYILKNIGSLENLSKVIQASGQTREGQPVSDKALAVLKWLGGLSGYSYDVEKYTKWSDRDRLKQLRDLARSKGLIE